MMQDVLVQSPQIEAIGPHAKTHSGKTPQEWQSVDELTRSMVSMHLVENVYFSMVKEKTAYELWKNLKALSEKNTSFLKLILIRQLFNMQMKETELARTHTNSFNRVFNQLTSLNLNFDKEVKVLALLSSLPRSCKVFSATVTNRSSKQDVDIWKRLELDSTQMKQLEIERKESECLLHLL